jgi:hypothetical protein
MIGSLTAGSRSRAASRVAAFALLLAGAGCVREVPVSMNGVAANERIRVSLSDAGSAQVEAVIGVRPSAVNGRLVAVTDSSISMLIRSGGGAGLAPDLVQELDFSFDDVLAVERLEVDRTRTGFLMAAGGLLVAGILAEVIGGETGATTPPPGSPPTEAVLPVPLGGLLRHAVALLSGG